MEVDKKRGKEGAAGGGRGGVGMKEIAKGVGVVRRGRKREGGGCRMG